MQNKICIVLIVLIIISSVATAVLVIGKKDISNQKVTVTFDTDGADKISNMILDKYSTILKPEDPKKEGYIFLNWMNGENEYNFDVPVSNDITLKAKYKKEYTAVEDIEFDSTLKLAIGEEFKLNAKVLPEDATNKKIKYTVSSTYVATIDEDGNLIAKNIGTCTITAKTIDGEKIAKCTLNVTRKTIND